MNPGDKLGPYEIVEAIGKGGMGEVYRARDSRVGRDVAVKVSEQRFGERFEREARAIAALNHPNICTLFDVGPNYLVMELVEGPTLAERIKEGAIPLEESLNIARQIADALEAAHEKGIVHRDLKPGNVIVKEDGSVKVLDFGLAKVAPTSRSSSDNDNPELSPTISMAATQAGVILGTAAYMSPEQARGKPVDKRADIWSFGVVLYEMVTGQKLFKGEDLTETLASVVKEKPDLSQIPDQLRPLLEKCLEKNPSQRLRDIGDWKALLDAGLAQSQLQAEARPSSGGPKWLWPAIAASLALIAGIGFWSPWRSAPEEPSLHLNVSLPPDTTPDFMELSPDGTRLLASFDNAIRIRRLDGSSDWEELVSPAGRALFWSADGRFVAFFTGAKLHKISAAGGPVQELCSGTGAGSVGDWNRNGVILFTNEESQLRRVNQDGGACEPVWEDDPNVLFQDPVFLPDGNHFLYQKRVLDDFATTGIYVAALNEAIDSGMDDSASRRILADQSSTVYVPAGDDGIAHILFQRDLALMAQPFDEDRLEPVGDPFPIAPQVARDLNGRTAASFASGTLIYVTGREAASQLTWFNRSGEQLGTVGPLAPQSGVWLSPDGTAVLADRFGANQRTAWMYDIARGTDGPLSPRGTPSGGAAWFPHGRRALFGSFGGPDGPAWYEKDLDAGGDPRLLFKMDRQTLGQWSPAGFSPDGQYLIGTETNPDTGPDISYIPWSETPDLSNKQTFLATRIAEGQARVSPDGRWMAYTTFEGSVSFEGSSGSEILIRPFPSGTGVWRVGPGREPQWSADGKRLYFVSSGETEVRLFEVSIEADGNGGVRVGTPRELFRFRAQGVVINGNVPFYAPHPDGERFLVNLLPEPTPTVLHAVTNFQSSAMLRDGVK